MIRFFSSLGLTFVLLLSIVLLLWLGTVFTLFPDLKQGIELMNDTLIQNWFMTAWKINWILPVWLLSLCLLSGLLFCNTLVCSLVLQLVTALKVKTLRRWSFFMIHIFFLMVLFCHGIALVAGEKKTNIIMFPGDIYQAGKLSVTLNSITFNGDGEFLRLGPKKSREMMTRKMFDRRANFADLVLVEDDKPTIRGPIKMLEPMGSGNLRVTLTKFILQDNGEGERIGVNLTITRNGFTTFFFVMYGFMIISLACFVAITWNPHVRTGRVTPG